MQNFSKTMGLLKWCYTLIVLSTSAAFKVSAPVSPVLAFRGQSAVLGCVFTPDPDLVALVVTWQRLYDARVVHSYYYQQDQLEQQYSKYKRRTSLFVPELINGNASLTIDAVEPTDSGWYLCTVSNAKGTDKAQVELKYGALYTEPRLSISVNCSNVIIQFETEGFPKPEVRWLGESGQNLIHHTEIKEITEKDAEVVLYYVKSSYVTVNQLNATFTLKNQLLNQDLKQHLSLRYGGEKDTCGANITVIILSILCVMLFLIMMFLLLRLRKKPFLGASMT